MDREIIVLVTSLIAVLLLLWWGTGSDPNGLSYKEILDDVIVQPELLEYGRKMDKKEIIKVTEGVYVAVNFALSNSIMIEGRTGLIIVDTTEDLLSAEEILKEFRKISQKPILAIVHTHNHADHTVGTPVFIEDTDNPPDIWGHYTEKSHVLTSVLTGPKASKGVLHQFGTRLGDQLFSAGIGRRLIYTSGRGFLPMFPNRLIGGDVTHEIAGINVSFLLIPGETPDQIAVWLEDQKVLLPADDIYKTFPNLYAIRGTPPRDSLVWHNSLAKMRKLRAEYLVPSHTYPVAGSEQIHDLFTVYMAGIQFVHDQTVRHLNKGLHPDEIASIIKLPASLASHEYLKQFYGTTMWSSKAVFEQYVGWFSGDVVDLLPLTPSHRSQLMVDMVGEKQLLKAAEDAIVNDNPQWALELATFVYRISPDNIPAKKARLRALKALAGKQTNPLARNFYLTTALEDYGKLDSRLDRSHYVENLEMKDLLNLMKTRLKAEEVDGLNLTLVFHFEDVNNTFCFQLRYSVLTIDKISDSESLENTACSAMNYKVDDGNKDYNDKGDDGQMYYDAKVTTSSRIWRDVVLKRKSSAMAYASGDIIIDGSVLSLRRFLSFIDTDT